jgi:hypothetical protein
LGSPYKFLSYTDLKNTNRQQAARIYSKEERPTVSEPDKNLSKEKTENLNKNKEMLSNLQMYKNLND